MALTRTLLATAVALALPLTATAGSFAGSTAGSSAGASSNSTSSSGDNKVVMQARDDAAVFVATEGRVRGAQLEAALRLMREQRAEARAASDLQLARSILAR